MDLLLLVVDLFGLGKVFLDRLSVARYLPNGVHFRVGLEEDRLCTLVLIGVRPDGTKELVAVEDGYRESWALRPDLGARRAQRGRGVRVRDTGIGIAPDVLPRVFDVFVQGARDRPLAGGLGLGLTILRNLIERHGGSVAAHSEGLGRGSEFVVRLPPAAQEPARRASWSSTTTRMRLRCWSPRSARRDTRPASPTTPQPPYASPPRSSPTSRSWTSASR